MVFLDYASTCPVVKYPQQLYRNVLGEGYFFNPNANYAYKEKRLLSEAENRVKKAIGAKGGKVVFGGTSSQLIENLVMAVRLKTDMDDKTDYQFYYSRYEHDAVERFNNWGSFYVYNFDDIMQEAKECEEEHVTPFVFWLGVSNITGEIFPVKDIGHLYHKYNAFYICDATALLGHTPVEPNIDDWCDFLILDGHKAGTELGIGCCWVSDRLNEWLHGFKLHGTPNLAGALTMTQAVEDACDVKYLSVSINRYNNLYDNLFYILKKHNIDFQVINGSVKTCAINAIRLPGFDARALQSYLASKEIYIGLGQASCADEADRRVLCQGYGLSEQEADEVIRISFGESSNYNEVHELVEKIIEFKQMFT